MYTVIPAEEVKNQLGQVGSLVKKSALLSGAWESNYAVAAIVIDGIAPPAEVHSKAADIWIIITGSAVFTLGGVLVDPTEMTPGEFTAASIEGGEARTIFSGDIVDIPAGVPHQINVQGGRAEFLIIKIPTHG